MNIIHKYLLILLLAAGCLPAFGQLPVAFQEDFDADAGDWTVRESEQAASMLEDGKYKVEHKRPRGSWLFWKENLAVNPNKNFEIETNLTHVEGEGNYGLIWGASGSTDLYALVLSPMGQYRVIKYEGGVFSEIKAYTDASDILKPTGQNNQLVLNKTGTHLSIYLNKKYLYGMNFLPFFGEKAGFITQGRVKFEVENFIVRQDQSLPVRYQENFNLSSKKWSRGESDKIATDVEDHMFTVKRKQGFGESIEYREVPLTGRQDFEIEVKMKQLQGNKDNGYGIVWGGDGKESYFAFVISSRGSYTVYRHQNGVHSDIKGWTRTEDMIHPMGESNVLKVQKEGLSLSFHVNDQKLQSIPYQRFFGPKIGFLVNDTMKIGVEELTLRQARKSDNITPPTITWVSPMNKETLHESRNFTVTAGITTPTEVGKLMLYINDELVSLVDSRDINKEAEYDAYLNQAVDLKQGENEIKLVVKNANGASATESRIVMVNEVKVPQRREGVHHALFFATDTYQFWGDLVNPVNDAKTVGAELEENYGFNVEIIENAPRNNILVKLKEYAKKEYGPQDQLLIFFAGHGQFDPLFGEGYVVCSNSVKEDEGMGSYISHSSLRTMINNIPCRHTLLAMDVCFGGTIDPFIAGDGARGEDKFREMTETEFIARKMKFKTRRYITSGGKEYVPDGRPGYHSPFVRKFLDALRNYGGEDRIITLSELLVYFEKILPEPRYGEFGNNEPGSDFLFIADEAEE